MKQNDNCKDNLPAFSRECKFYTKEYTTFQEICPACEAAAEKKEREREVDIDDRRR